MFLGTPEIVDVEVQSGYRESSVDIESTQDSIQNSSESIRWIPAAKAKYLCHLNQSSFRRGIEELHEIHHIPWDKLRRGKAKNTEYSREAIDLLKILDSQKDRITFNSLKQALVSPAAANSEAIVLRAIDQHTEIARHSFSAANQNLAKISGQIANLMGNYERLGEALGEQAGAKFEEGFTNGVSRSIQKISEV